ncbi:MAG: hypothetical protein ACOVKP_04960 [Flavobacterium sp.]
MFRTHSMYGKLIVGFLVWSVRAKPKVHHMAKKVKKQLHMYALSVAAHDPEMKQYLTRKVEKVKCL